MKRARNIWRRYYDGIRKPLLFPGRLEVTAGYPEVIPFFLNAARIIALF
jgi:hypothetical protein